MDIILKAGGLPLMLLTLQFCYKFFIDKEATTYDFVISILELPLSIMFLSLSFFAALVITNISQADLGFKWFLGTLIASIFSVFFWKRSVVYYEREKLKPAFWLGILNLAIAAPLFVYSIITLTN
ncbi:hypothetical protein [Mangrovibacterium lignilyticum]|uniref:hypothetical protein n=1 Tax=Mangrovibacterium lignilyticum TaxID=2668052 RepID=UPI0013D12175|nr:hypothetical protein [Mangrovibacterium lignilyticum]